MRTTKKHMILCVGHYHQQKIREDAFIEHEQVYEGLYYGTLKSEIQRIEAAGKTVIFDVDVKGGINLKRILGNRATSVFVCPPSIEELSRRLHGRGDTSEEMIQKRLAKAGKRIVQGYRKGMKKAEDFRR